MATMSPSEGAVLSKKVQQLSAETAELSLGDIEQLVVEVVNAANLQKRRANLKAFSAQCHQSVHSSFSSVQPEVADCFAALLSNLGVRGSEQASDSTSAALGTVTLELPGLEGGVNVMRLKDTFSVDEGRTLIERNEVRIKMGGLDAYSGYWLACDAPVIDHADAIQEEGIDTLRRVMEAAGIPLQGDVSADALEYPFLAVLLAPFGAEAMQPFERHLRSLHTEYGQEHGGCWYKCSTAQPMANGNGQGVGVGSNHRPRGELSAAEEAELELSKLDL